MQTQHKVGGGSGGRFRHFFLRGLALVLPTALTIWILTLAYNFVQGNIAGPINRGLRWGIVQTGWPPPADKDYIIAQDRLTSEEAAEWQIIERQNQARFKDAWPTLREQEYRDWIAPYARREALEAKWNAIRIGTWPVFDLIGLIIAIVGIYILGALLGGYIGGRIVKRVEELIGRIPLIKSVYPSVKQVTDFIVGSNSKVDKAAFNRVVAVQYPRKGIWSVGLMTGDTMRAVQDATGQDCVTVFIPSSPTPFTGYVITVPREDTIDIPVSIEDAIKFVVSLGVVIPTSQIIDPSKTMSPLPPALPVPEPAQAPERDGEPLTTSTSS